jgi:hypothetical protein
VEKKWWRGDNLVAAVVALICDRVALVSSDLRRVVNVDIRKGRKR